MKLTNMGSYLGDPLIAAIGGSWLAPKDLIAEENWDGITRIAREASEKLEEFRGKE